MKSSRSYNIAVDCLDRPASLPKIGKKAALIYLHEKGHAESWSFQKLATTTQAFASSLTIKGLKRGERVVLQLSNSPKFPIAFLGVVKAGLIPIPISTSLTKLERDYILKDSGARLLVDEKIYQTILSQSTLSASHRISTSLNDPAFWLYTSGTEGRPKAVIHAHRSIPAHDARCRFWLDLKPNDIVYNTSSLNWSYALTCGMFDLWRHGVTTIVSNGSLHAERICRILHDQMVTIFMSVPGIYRRLVEHLESYPNFRQSFKKVRVCLSAGEKLPQKIRERFQELTGIAIREGLGMTEHSVYLVQRKDRAIVPGSCGQALPGQRIAILRKTLAEAKPGEVGILASHLSCSGLMLGYYRRSREMRKTFRGDWFLSGDLAYRDRRGNFFYVSRRDDVITAGGYRISPLEVEAVLNAHPAVRESAVRGEEIESGKTIVTAAVVLKSGKKANSYLERSILSQVQRGLASYKVPRKMVFVREIPKTSTGKVLRKVLPH